MGWEFELNEPLESNEYAVRIRRGSGRRIKEKRKENTMHRLKKNEAASVKGEEAKRSRWKSSGT